jgi:predicted 2-oxoglutarate/Fe(II)-dependent dioxygenase YbiX
LNGALQTAVERRLGPDMMKAYHFKLGRVERFCIGAYTADRADYFRPHRDNTTEKSKARRFAVTLNLNDGFEGGGLRFPEYSDDILSPPAGGALVFSCSLMHEAMPVTAGTRYVALTFLYDAIG